MLFFTGIARTASDVARTYVNNIGTRRRQLESMRRMVEESVDLLVSGLDLHPFGQLLHEAWQTKRSLSPHVSTPQIDAVYECARQAGAVGGKLTGAGGGGFLLLFVPPDKKLSVRQAMAPLLEVPFAFEAAGSQIIFYEPGVDYEEAEKTRLRADSPPPRLAKVI
jgi:D-glycero-alpha-D-manno-heptose-7-phosphate kinase